MKYRVRIDQSFDKESDAQDFYNLARNLLSKAVNINEDNANEEISFCDIHLCGHDEGKPCIPMEREVLRENKVMTVQ